MSAPNLKKDLGFISAFSVVVGSVIGSGVFLKPGVVLSSTGNSTIALLAWLVGGIITIASGLTIAELAARIPKTGGLYTYIEETFGKTWGFLSGWIQSVLFAPGIVAALGLYFASLFHHFFQLPSSWEIATAIGVVLFLTIVNIIGTKYGGWVQTATTFAKLIPIALIAIFGVWKGDAQVFNSLVTTEGEISFSAAILATLFAYDGWILVGSIAGEVKNSAKVLPKAITAGLLLVTSVYLIINIAILQVLPAAEVVRLGDNAASHVSEILFGNIGGKILSIGILVSIFGTLNAKIMTYPRVPYAMALRGQLPFSKQLSQVSVRWSTPIVAILSTVGLSILYMMVGDPNKLTDICMFTIVFFYILAFLAVFRLRRVQPNMEGNYRVPLYPWVPGIAILGSAFILIETAIQQTDYAIFSVLLTIIGLPIFWFLQKKKNSSTASISTN